MWPGPQGRSWGEPAPTNEPAAAGDHVMYGYYAKAWLYEALEPEEEHP